MMWSERLICFFAPWSCGRQERRALHVLYVEHERLTLALKDMSDDVLKELDAFEKALPDLLHDDN